MYNSQQRHKTTMHTRHPFLDLLLKCWQWQHHRPIMLSLYSSSDSTYSSSSLNAGLCHDNMNKYYYFIFCGELELCQCHTNWPSVDLIQSHTLWHFARQRYFYYNPALTDDDNMMNRQINVLTDFLGIRHNRSTVWLSFRISHHQTHWPWPGCFNFQCCVCLCQEFSAVSRFFGMAFQYVNKTSSQG